MKPNLLVAFAVFTQLVSAAWGSAVQVTAADEGGFTGLVRDTSNIPVAGVKVSAFGVGSNVHRETTTAATGEFALPNLPRGLYRVHAERQDFQTVIRIEAIERTPYKLNFFLPTVPVRNGTELGVLTGSVRNFDNVSLPGVKITVRVSGKTLQAVSDARGNYSVENLPAGVLEIVAEHDGFQPMRVGDIRLTGTFTAQLHLRLQPVAARAGTATP